MKTMVVTGSAGGHGSACVPAFEEAGFAMTGLDVDDDPEDVAEAAVCLATAPFVTGAVLTIDGGWTAR